MAALLIALLLAQTADFDQRAREIVSRMTLDEKLTELHGLRDATHNRYVPGIARLGIPELRITNGPAGAGPDGAGAQARATALPAPIALAATWDVQLAQKYGEVIGSESRLLGNGLVEAPTINIARVPQNGRTFEGFGEDPYLAGSIAAREIEGIQSHHVIADVKHYAANNQETDRRTVDERIDERALREIYLPAFEASLKEGHAGAMMCAYPKVNGMYCCENGALMNGIVKGEWGFRGFITSDFHAVHGSATSALAGLDLEMPSGDFFGDRLKREIEAGTVPMSLIDDKLVRRFRTMMEIGVWDDVEDRRSRLFGQAGLPVLHGAIAREIAEAGIVLLKNEGVLPLNAAELKSVALIGPYAQNASTGGGGSSHVLPLYMVNPADGISRRLRPGARLIRSNDASAAAAADVAIVIAGDFDREGHDQPLLLDRNQDALISAVIAANPRTVVVLKTGSAVLMPWAERAAAIVEAWYPGEEDGNAVAAVLFGAVNPSGKLPITFPKRVDDTLAANREQYPGIGKVATYSEGIDVGYRHYDRKTIEPFFPFGFGLSYTKFSYSNLRVAPPSVEFDVTNVGSRAGADVAQLYVSMPPSAGEPPRQLKAFAKVSIDPGRTAHVRLALDDRAFQYWDRGWKTAPGKYTIMVGSSSRNLPLHATIDFP